MNALRKVVHSLREWKAITSHGSRGQLSPAVHGAEVPTRLRCRAASSHPDSRSESATLRARRGYTLAEMMLVLAILVIITAVVLPTFSNPLETEELRKAADQVRAVWTQARVEAMTTGLTQVFRFQPESGYYAVAPWIGGDAELEISSLGSGLLDAPLDPNAAQSAMSSDRGPRSQNEDEEVDPTVPRLPEGVAFEVGDTLIDSRAVNVAMAEGDALVPPILFYSDGTTSTAAVVLANERQQKIMLELRGLTGTITVSDVDSSQMVDPEEQ